MTKQKGSKSKSKSSKSKSKSLKLGKTVKKHSNKLMKKLDIVDLNGKQPHKPLIKKDKPKVVIFLIYADWCTHCQHMKNDWHSMKNTLLKKYPSSFEIEEIESAEQPSGLERLKNKYLLKQDPDIPGYPTIGGIKNGSLVMYNKPARDYNSLTNFAVELYKGFHGGSKNKKNKSYKRKKQENCNNTDSLAAILLPN